MSSLVYLLLLIFISLYACNNARYLCNTDYKETPKGFHYFPKGVILQDTGKVKHTGHNDQIENHGSSGGANNIKHIELMKVPWNIKEDAIDFKITASSSPAVLQEATKIEEWKRRARLMLGRASPEAEETVDSKEDEAVEDIVAMDYAQPHKKTPIHNR